MKDFLKTHWWENQFPRNPTQTHYNRFLQKAGSDIKSRFTDSKKEFDRQVSSELQTVYSKEFLEN